MQDEIMPKITDQSDVKVIICYLLHKTGRSVTEEQLGLICESVGIDYFMLKDAVNDLIGTGALVRQDDMLSVGEKGRQSSEYFSKFVSLVFRRRILKEALMYFRSINAVPGCVCEVTGEDERYSIHFSISGGDFEAIDLTLYAGSEEKARKMAENIRKDPMSSCNKIVTALMQDNTPDINTDEYL